MPETRPVLTRALAFIIDLTILYVVGVTLSFLIEDQLLYRRVKFVIDCCYWGLEIVQNASVGKRLIGLEIVQAKVGASLGLFEKIVRFLIKHLYWLYPALLVSPGQEMTLIPGMVCLGGYLLVFMTKSRALHDLLSGTIVVKSAPSPLRLKRKNKNL